MLRLPQHSSSRLVHALHNKPAALGSTIKPCPSSLWRRDLASSGPHDNTQQQQQQQGQLVLSSQPTAAALCSDDAAQRSLLLSRWLQADRRRATRHGGSGLLVDGHGVLAVAPSVTQRRGLASGAGKGKGKDGGDEEGLFDRLKKTFAEEIEKVLTAAAAVVHTYGVMYMDCRCFIWSLSQLQQRVLLLLEWA